MQETLGILIRLVLYYNPYIAYDMRRVDLRGIMIDYWYWLKTFTMQYDDVINSLMRHHTMTNTLD